MSELDLKITAVEFVLRSFARARNEDARKNALREKLETIPYLDIYIGCTKERLQTFWDQLQQLKMYENMNQREAIIRQAHPRHGLLLNIWNWLFPKDYQDGSIDSSSILRSALRISFKKSTPKNKKKKQTLIGNAVAISPTLALTALHGKADNGYDITLHTHSGALLQGKVVLNVFEQDLVDIAVIELIDDGVFPHFTPVLGCRPVKLLESVYIVGYKLDARDMAMEAMFDSKVNVIERFERSALFQSSYVSFGSLSGAGVVVMKDRNDFKVIGVHVASNEKTIYSSPVIKTEDIGPTSYKSGNVAPTSFSSNIHGYSAYTVVCEIARVPELIAFLRQRGLIS